MNRDPQPRTSEEVPLDVELIRQKISSAEHTQTDASEIRLRLPSQDTLAPLGASLLRASPLGLEVILNSHPADLQIALGTKLEIEVYEESQFSLFVGSVVSIGTTPSNQRVIAIRTHERAIPNSGTTDRRRQVRWQTSSQYFPTGVASNPAKYNDFIYFRVQDISRGGIRILTSMRNKFIARDMRLDCIVSFPMISQITLQLRAANVTIVNDDGKDLLSIGAEVLDYTDAKLQVVSQYLAQFGDASVLKALKSDGLLSPTISDALEFSFVRNSAEYGEVLEVRRAAYAKEGKIPPDVSAADMSDVYDSRSRIIACRLRERIVATARLTFHELNDFMEHEEFIRWSSDLPRREESVEVTRACTHPDFHRSRVFFALIGFIVVSALQARRSWVITSCTSELVSLYEGIGMRQIGKTYSNPALNNTKHFLLVGSIPDAILGRSVGPIMWNLVWKNALRYAQAGVDLEIDTVSKVRMGLYRVVSPVVPFLRFVQNRMVKIRGGH